MNKTIEKKKSNYQDKKLKLMRVKYYRFNNVSSGGNISIRRNLRTDIRPYAGATPEVGRQ
jgi:hypothetical protein